MKEVKELCRWGESAAKDARGEDAPGSDKAVRPAVDKQQQQGSRIRCPQLSGYWLNHLPTRPALVMVMTAFEYYQTVSTSRPMTGSLDWYHLTENLYSCGSIERLQQAEAFL